MSNAKIRKAFELPLRAWAITKSLPVAWENVTLNQPAGAYLQANLIPNRTVSETLDQLHRRYIGIFQISLLMPIGQGPGEAESLASELDALFPLNEKMLVDGLEVQLTSPMSASPAFQDSTRYIIAVSANYRADTV